jgi:hypothetical protein
LVTMFFRKYSKKDNSNIDRDYLQSYNNIFCNFHKIVLDVG